MVFFDIGINFLTASISNFLAWDVGIIYLTAVALAGLLGSYFCEMCWRYGGVTPERTGVPSNA